MPRPPLFQEHSLAPATVTGAIWPYGPAFSKPPHFHAQIEFLILMRGRATMRIGHALHPIHGGQLVWLLPGIEHHLDDASSDFDFRVVHVEPDLCADVARELAPRVAAVAAPRDFYEWTRNLGWLAAGRPVVEIKKSDQDRLLDDCEVTCSNGLSPEQTPLRVRSALTNAWRATMADHDSRRPNSLVELASCLLLEQPALDRPSVCRALDVSEGYLSRRFRAELGVSFLEQRARLRLSRFVTHVTRERRNYVDAALRAGFGSYSQMHRVFSHLVGEPPRAYLRGGRNRRADWRTA
jgi:AraC-like DNA-binding protein